MKFPSSFPAAFDGSYSRIGKFLSRFRPGNTGCDDLNLRKASCSSLSDSQEEISGVWTIYRFFSVRDRDEIAWEKLPAPHFWNLVKFESGFWIMVVEMGQSSKFQFSVFGCDDMPLGSLPAAQRRFL